MREVGEIYVCEPEPFIYFENGQLAVTDGSSVWLVIVTCEAMMATAQPPEKSLRRLVKYAAYYSDLAATAIRRGEDVDGKVWVNEAMVRAKPALAASVTKPLQRVRRKVPVLGSGDHAQHGA